MKKFSILVIVILLAGLFLAACGGEVNTGTYYPEGDTGANTEEDTQTSSQVEETQAEPAVQMPAPPNVTVSLPAEAINRLKNVAESQGYVWQELAADHTVFYAFPDMGIAFLLTPIAEGPGYTAVDLAEQLANIEDIMLGGLTVITGFDSFPFDEGDYLITLASDGKSVFFTRADGTVFSSSAVIRELPQQLPRELALITSSQMCLAWNQTQICALVDTPLRNDLLNQMIDAINILGIDQSSIAIERAIPDVEGFNMIETCAEALSREIPAYGECRSTILAAPAVADDAFNITSQEEGTSIGIAMLIALEPIEDQVFLDPQLTQLAEADTLPAGEYLTYEVLLPGENPTPEEPISTRVLQQGSQGEEFYLPAQSGGIIIGNPISGDGPSNLDEAVIANLWCRGRCYWKWWQCHK